MNELAELNALVARGETEAVIQHIKSKKITSASCAHLPSWSTPISVAAVNGRLDILKILLSMGFTAHKDRHPIHFACIMGHLDIVKSLVEEQNVNVMLYDSKGQTPLYLAVFNDKFDIVKYLLEHGADVNNNGRMPPIVIAVIHYKPEICRYLVDQGAEVNVHDNFGRSPLAAAARSGSRIIAAILLESGADVNIRGREGTPFLAACNCGRLAMMKLLHANGAVVNIRDMDGDTALHLAVAAGHFSVARYLIINYCLPLGAVNHLGKTAFLLALENMDVEMMYLFHQGGYNPARELSGYFHFEIESPAKEVLFQCISDLTNIPHTLQELACFTLRKSLGSNVRSSVNELPIPQPIRDYVTLNHVPYNRSDMEKMQ